MKNKKLEMNNIFCTICHTNKATLLHHTDYKKGTVVPVCDICHKKIHMAKRKPNHFSSSKIFKYIPEGSPTPVSITMTPNDHYKIQHISPGGSFSQNIRIAYGEYINYEKLAEIKIGKYYFILRKKTS